MEDRYIFYTQNDSQELSIPTETCLNINSLYNKNTSNNNIIKFIYNLIIYHQL